MGQGCGMESECQLDKASASLSLFFSCSRAYGGIEVQMPCVRHQSRVWHPTVDQGMLAIIKVP